MSHSDRKDRKMPRKDYTEICVLLDRSGSMAANRAEHEGGLNGFIDEQRKLEGEVRFTFIKFDGNNPCDIQYDGVPLADVGRCTLEPRGNTPLLDAIGKSVNHLHERLKTLKKKQAPGAVVFLIITDGAENASREYTKEAVRGLIQQRETDDKWRFVFLGANIDAFGEAGKLGVAEARTSGFVNNAVGTQSAYGALASNVKSMRRARAGGQSVEASYSTLEFTEEQRREAMAGEKK
jgi:hypothetical protein